MNQTRNFEVKPSQPQSVVPQAHQANDQTSLLARRKTVNQNASQLNDLLAWDKGASGNAANNYKSQER